jgi:hypothetical protein
MPRQAGPFRQSMQRVADLARMTRRAGKLRHLSISGDPPPGNAPNHRVDAIVGRC